MNRTLSRGLTCAAALAVMSSSAMAGNLLTNPDFESPAAPTTNFVGSGWNRPTGYTAQLETWATYFLTNGVAFAGWDNGASPGGLYQDVAVSGTGTYTFSMWVKMENNFNPTGMMLQMEWLDAGLSPVQAASVVSFTNGPKDNVFHQYRVTGTCTSPSVAWIRAGIYAGWVNTNGASTAAMFDTAELQKGAYAPVPGNNSFETGQNTPSFANSQWTLTGSGSGRESWAARSGNIGWALYGFDTGLPEHSPAITHRVYPTGTGVHTFAVWIKRESTNMPLTNVLLSIQWLGSDYATTVNDTSFANYTNFPPDNTWYQYYVEGNLTNAGCAEAVLTINPQFQSNTNVASQKAAMVDDITFRSGSITDNTVNIDYSYFAPSFEPIPGTTNLWTFMQINYETTQTIYRVLTDTEISANASETGAVSIKVTYQDPVSLNYLDTWASMTRVGQVTVDSGNPFYGRPTAGSKVLDVWQYAATQPLDTNGVPYTNNIPVFASPYLRNLQGIVETETWFLSPNSAAGARTNNYAGDVQYFVTSFFGADYASWNVRLPMFTTLSNGGFESVNGQTALTNTDWQFSRSAGRDTWSARIGNYGAYLPGWQNGLERMFQYVATTGGTYTFSTWILAENGFDPTYTTLGLLWYNSSHQLIQRDEFDLSVLPTDKLWHPAYVSGTCTIPGTAYVVPYLESRFVSAPVNGAVFIDDFEFYSGGYTGSGSSLRNLSFETRAGDNGWRGAEGWMTTPESAGGSTASERKDWAWYTGSRGVALISYTGEGGVPGSNYQLNITQSVTPGTGTYTFSSRMVREGNSGFSNAALRIEWYDRNYIAVQAPTVTNFVPTNDWNWKEYYVTGTCSDTNLYEVRCVVYAQWFVNPVSPGPGEAAKIDDVHFNRGGYENHLNLEYGYHNSIASNRFEEVTPGAYGTFVDVDYATTTTTFRVVAPQSINVRAEETAAAKIKVTYQHPVTGNYLDVFANLTLEGSATISAGSPFHGLPSSGSVTVNVWKYDFPMPRDAGMPAFTNPIIVYYAPYFVATLSNSPSAVQQDQKYLTASGSLNNAYTDTQYFNDNFFGVDYSYTNVFTTNLCSDCDLDGLPDWWEILKFGATTNDASGDHDGDGQDNNAEYAGDTDPYSGASFFPAAAASTSAVKSIITLRITGSSTARVYDAYWKTNLLDQAGGWTAYGLNVQGNGGVVTLSVTNTPNANRYYRAGAHP